MQPYLPVGERLPGFPEVFPGLTTDSPRYLVFPQDSAATFEESTNRCRALNGRLVNLEDPSELEVFGYLLSTPAYIGSWQGATPTGCILILPGGSLMGATKYSMELY